MSLTTDLDIDAFEERLLSLQFDALGVSDTFELESVSAHCVSPQAGAGQHVDQAVLHRISAALHRIDEGCYGLCLICQQPISTTRLQADLVTEHCAECAARNLSLLLTP